MYTPDDILNLSDNERRNLKLRKRYRKYKKSPRPSFTRDELIEHLRECQIRSCSAFDHTRKPTDPNVYDYRKEFGSWKDAVLTIFGSEIAVDMNAEYVLNSVLNLELWSVPVFKTARKKDPVSIPSWRKVQNTWGSYSNLFECARRLNLKHILTEYQKLTRKLGRTPTLGDLKTANLRIEQAIKFYGSKNKMDDFLSNLRG